MTTGQIDTWYYLNVKGEIERKGQDPNRSGKPTLWVIYDNGQPVRSEEDAGNGRGKAYGVLQNGKVSRIDEDSEGKGKQDTFSYFENDQLVRKEMDRKGSGKIDLWGYYRNGAWCDRTRTCAATESEPGSLFPGRRSSTPR